MMPEETGMFIMAMGILICACILTFGQTKGCTDDHWKRQAVKHGAAEYATDEKGNPVWRWKE